MQAEAEHEENLEEAENSFIIIDELQNHGISAADIKKLKLAGIHTVCGVLMQTKKV